ncbi:MAG: tetratricopeptide repeat protein, partial [Opitutales bacterium]
QRRSGGPKWNLSDQKGGGTVISSSRDEDINNRWSRGSSASHPEPDMFKDATFRLAVAYQGTSDYANAYTMFDDFTKKYPEDKLAADCYLSLGDIVISRIPSDVQPTFAQIDESRAHYAKVRELSPRDAKLVNDSTFNEGDLLERIASNPEGIVDETWSVADKDENGALSKTEYGAVERFRGISYADANRDGDEKVDYSEIFDLFSLLFYKQMGELFEKYKLDNANLEGAELSRATHKVGIAYEKQGRPEDMLREYYGAITENNNKLGNDPSSVGIDEILKVYSKKYEQYHKQYTRTLALLDAIENPGQSIKFSVTTRAGSKEINTTVKGALGNRRELIHWLNAVFAGMDQKARTDVVNFRTGIKQNWINATRTRFNKRLAKFPSDLAPKEKFGTLYQNAARQGQLTLAFRMRWILDEIGAGVNDGYSPNKNDFGVASPSVLLWMARTSIKQGNSETAAVGLQRLVSVFSDSGEFVFDALVLLGDIQFRNGNFHKAEQYFSRGYTNFAWHPRASEALLKLGDSRLRLGKIESDVEKLVAAEESFGAVMENDELDMYVRAEAMYKMGESRLMRRDYLGATDYYRQVYNGFPGAVDWAGKAFDQAIDCFGRLGDADAEAKLNIQKERWARKFNAN